MSTYRLKRQGEQLVFEALKGAKWAYNAHDIDWQKIKVSVKVRGRSGMTAGDNAFTFTSFGKEDVVFVLVGIDEANHYFWVITSKYLKGKKSFYASIKNSIPLEKVPETIKILTKHDKAI